METQKISILSIDLVESSIKSSSNPLHEGIKFNFNVDFEFRVHAETSELSILSNISITTHDNPNETLGLFKIGTRYKFEDLNTFYNEKRKQHIIPKEILIELGNTALNTARGYISSLTKGTYIHYAILPFVDITNHLSSTE